MADVWNRLAMEPDVASAEAMASCVARAGLHGSREVMLQESWRARKALGSVDDSRYTLAMRNLADRLAKAAFKMPAEL